MFKTLNKLIILLLVLVIVLGGTKLTNSSSLNVYAYTDSDVYPVEVYDKFVMSTEQEFYRITYSGQSNNEIGLELNIPLSEFYQDFDLLLETGFNVQLWLNFYSPDLGYDISVSTSQSRIDGDYKVYFKILSIDINASDTESFVRLLTYDNIFLNFGEYADSTEEKILDFDNIFNENLELLDIYFIEHYDGTDVESVDITLDLDNVDIEGIKDYFLNFNVLNEYTEAMLVYFIGSYLDYNNIIHNIAVLYNGLSVFESESFPYRNDDILYDFIGGSSSQLINDVKNNKIFNVGDYYVSYDTDEPQLLQFTNSILENKPEKTDNELTEPIAIKTQQVLNTGFMATFGIIAIITAIVGGAAFLIFKPEVFVKVVDGTIDKSAELIEKFTNAVITGVRDGLGISETFASIMILILSVYVIYLLLGKQNYNRK